MLVGMVHMPPVTKVSGSQIYDTAGSYTFTVPAGVSSIDISTVGGAGGGASGWTYIVSPPDKQPTYAVDAYGGDGGSAATATSQVSVTPNSEVVIVVGAGGAGGVAFGSTWYGSDNANPGEAGEDTTVVYAGSEVVKADAGEGGQVLSDGAGGLGSASTGDTKTDGVTGAGGAGGYSNTGNGTAGDPGSVTLTW